MTHAIETHRLTRRFGRTPAVHDLALVVPAGSVFALLGANGAGKTTTIRLLMNLLAPSSGSARVLGVDSRRLGPRERAQLGYVSENQPLPRWMTVRQFLDYCRPFYPTWDRDLERSLLAQFALPLERRLKHLSRGMVMKAALLASLAYRPKLLVLDEPFSGLDPVVRDDLVGGLLATVAQGDCTVLISSHDIEEVERLCDWIALLEDGRLQFTESTESLLRRFRRVEVRSAATAVTTVAPTWRAIERAGDRLRFVDTCYDAATGEADLRARFSDGEVTTQPMTLREIFLTLARANRSETKGVAA